MSKRKRWSNKEDEFLIQNYNEINFDDIKKKLPHRTENSIRLRANMLGLSVRINDKWSEEEIQLIKDGLTLMEIVKITGRSYTAVNKKTKYYFQKRK